MGTVVVIAGNGQVARWVHEELSQLVAGHLARPFYWIWGDDLDEESPPCQRIDDGLDIRSLDEHLALRERGEQVWFVRLLVPGDDAVDGEDPRLERLEHRLRVIGKGQSPELVTLHIPTEDPESPTLTQLSCRQGWRNVLVSPEDHHPPGW